MNHATRFARLVLLLALVGALALAGCGGSDSGSPTMPMTETPPTTPYEMAVTNIAAADTADAAQAAYDAVKGDVTAAEGDKLQAAVDDRIAALDMMGRAADQKMALMTAAGNVDTSDLMTAEDIDAANTAIYALKMALAAAVDVSDADKAMYQATVDVAGTAVMTAQGVLDTEGRMAAQRTALTNTMMAARTAVGMVDGDATDDQVTAADNAITALQAAIDDAEDLPEGDAAVASGQGTLDTLVIQLASAKTARMMAMDEAADEQRMAAINAANDILAEKEAALKALDDDATDQQKLDAQRLVEAAANALRDALRMNGGSDADIEAAIRKSATAKVAADALQATITAAANAKAAAQMAAINAAQMTLSNAEDALAELGEDATDKEKRDTHRAVESAAAALVQALEDNDGSADQIAAATMKRKSAKMMADDLTSPIEIADQRTAITDALADLATKVAAVNDDSTDAEVKAADDAIAAAEKAIADATELPDAETTAHAMVVKAHANLLATTKTSRDKVIAAKAEEDEAEARVASNKVAITKKTAISTEGDSATVPARPFDLTSPPADAAAPTDAENYVLTVEHTGTAVEVAVADGALPADNDPMYEQAATFDNGQMLVRNIGTERKIIVVHTDIEAPDQVAFSSEHGLTVDRNMETTAMDTYAVLADDNEKVAASVFPDKPDQDQDFPAYDADTTAGKRGQFSGTFDGANGLFRCVASDTCTVMTDAMGKIEALTVGDWEFTPAAGATVSKPDGDYLTWGFWLDTTTKDGEIASYDTVQTFATSSLPTATTLGNVEGMATYEGDAAGVYVRESQKEDGTLNKAISGRFTADVALKAYFEATGAFAADRIQGTISDFDLDGGPDNSWNVNVSAVIEDGGGLSAGVASGMMGDNGSLSGQFHSPADRAETDAPPVLVGEFNANFVNGAAAGAFGARTDD